MTREDARYYLQSSGFSEEQINTIEQAFMEEPKTGYWIEYTKVIIPEPFNSWKQAWKCSWKCSECGYGGQDDDEDGWLEWKYCPNCGAKMQEVKE